MEAQKVRFKAKSYFKDAWWEGYYVYSSINDKHYIVQDAQENGNLNQFVNFCHYAEVDPATLEVVNNKPTKPISELTKEDAIEIAKAALNDDSIDVVKGELKNKGDFYEILFSDKYWFIIHLNDGFECEHRDEYGESFRYYPAKATDKARELGYDV